MSIKKASASDEMRSLLRFDTSGIPVGKIIQSAILRLNFTTPVSTTSNPKSISAYALTQAWVEGTKAGSGTADGLTWNKKDATTNWTTAGGTYRMPSVAMAVVESSGVSPPPGTFTTGWLTWELKALTQEWVDGVTINNGVLMMSTVADEMKAVSRTGTSGSTPQLVVIYQ